MKASNSKSNRVQNRNVILKMLALSAPISRIELSTLSGLSKMSLTNIISEFKEEGLVVETGIDSSASGKRKPVLLDLVEGSMCAIGIHITRSFVEGCLADIKGSVLYTKREELDDSITAAHLVDLILNLIQTIHNLSMGKIAGIGIASMGPLDLEKGVILNPSHFYGIENIAIVDAVKAVFPNLPVFLCKNTNSAAVAEKYYGADKTIKNFAYIGVSKGVGCSAVINDSLISGAKGYACEIGHVSVNPEGPLCSCGNRGCLELYASTSAAEQFAEAEIKAGKKSSLSLPVTYEQLILAARRDDEVALRAIDRQCKYLSVGVINLINVFDPETVIVGNEIAIGGTDITNRIKHYVGTTPIAMKRHPVSIAMSKFFDKAPLLGSAAWVFENVFFS